MNRKTIFYIVFFAVLVIGFYATMNLLVPGFGKSTLAPIGKVEPFAFINQDGGTVTEENVKGKVFVAEYFFTTCKSICPIMNANMKIVYDKFKDEKDFLILSHTSDPKNDSVRALKEYSMQWNADPQKWIFLTGSKDSLYRQARYSYKIDDPNNNPINTDEDFIHSQYFALVDKKGVVRNIYDGRIKTEIDQMINKIESLLKEN